MARQVLPVLGQAIGSIWGPWGAAIGGLIGSGHGDSVDPEAHQPIGAIFGGEQGAEAVYASEEPADEPVERLG